jgi:glycosyltransferase involved in cell wall biosynthesis
MNSLIVPVYRNEDSLADLLDTIDVIDVAVDGELEAVFVVDGSPDRSAEVLRSALPTRAFRSRLVLLSRNFGAFAAIRVGLEHATGQHFAVMAADLQEPPELPIEFFRVLAAGDYDIVVGTRTDRADPILSRWSSALFWRFYRRHVVPSIPRGGIDVFGCNQTVRDHLLACEESNTSLVALLFWLGFRRHEVAYTRRPRLRGKSAWNRRKRFTYFADSIFSFTDLPVRLLMWFGLAGVLVSMIFGLLVLIERLVNATEVPGYAAITLTVLFFGGLNSLGLGVIGSYVWRAYENTKRRPLAVVFREFTFGPQR